LQVCCELKITGKKADGFIENVFRATARMARSSKLSKVTKMRTRLSKRHRSCVRQVPERLREFYVNTVNLSSGLPGAWGLPGWRGRKVKLIATDLFAEMSSYLQQGTITASIYQQPHRQGQGGGSGVMVDHLANKANFPLKVHFSPGRSDGLESATCFRENATGGDQAGTTGYRGPV